jgi:dihydrofolate reductase
VAKLRVHNYCMSLDGYVAGPDQSREDPLGVGAEALHEWLFETRAWRELTGEDPGDLEEGVDDRFFRAGFEGLGAWIMGRNMFGPVRDDWGDEDWRGWWGDEPPYHCDVYVLTHHEREDVPMAGGTTFHFVTDGIEAALERALTAADGKDVRLGGGAATVRQYLRAGLVDELHLPVVPVLLRGGERLFESPDDLPAGYQVVELVSSPAVAHYRIAKA